MESQKTVMPADWYLGKYFHFVVLVFSVINLSLFIYGGTFRILSPLLSLFGIYTFWKAHNNEVNASKWLFYWAAVQCLAIEIHPFIYIDLGQGIDFLLSYSTQTTSNGVIRSRFYIGINCIGILLTFIAWKRLEYEKSEKTNRSDTLNA